MENSNDTLNQTRNFPLYWLNLLFITFTLWMHFLGIPEELGFKIIIIMILMLTYSDIDFFLPKRIKNNPRLLFKARMFYQGFILCLAQPLALGFTVNCFLTNGGLGLGSAIFAGTVYGVGFYLKLITIRIYSENEKRRLHELKNKGKNNNVEAP